MEIHTLTLGDYQTNCYIVSDGDGNAAVIDPGYAPERILTILRDLHLTPRAILLTHGHFDHVGGVKAIAEATGCSVWMQERELTLPPFMTAGALYYTDGYSEGDTVAVGGLTFTVLETPGHTPGSVCLQCETVLFSGDTLFAAGCGRTDFPGSSPADMRRSLHRLAQLPEALQVCPGHGEMTTLRRERHWLP